MATFFTILLHPTNLTVEDEFAIYLDGLAITAFDVSFTNPDGQEIGQTQDFFQHKFICWLK